jgi:putative (di)nucleoside polyphosphate hydrolase
MSGLRRRQVRRSRPGRGDPASLIDAEGYRANVGIMLSNRAGQLLWAKRAGMEAWQFPQGGIRPSENPEGAMYRELREEIGLLPEHVAILGCTQDWLRYRLPAALVRWNARPVCLGQKQIWFLLRLEGGDELVRLDHSARPEFDHWRWIDFWDPVAEVVAFKQQVYRQALQELRPLLAGCGA